MQSLTDARRHELAVSAEAYARLFAESANNGEFPRRAESVVVMVVHQSSPVYALFRDADWGAQLDSECWCTIVDATEWGLEAFAPGHVGLALAIGESVQNRVLTFATGMVS